MRNIYVVDDDFDVRDSLHLLLAGQADTRVTGFGSGEAFLRQAPQLAPGVVLLDYAMPGLNGLDVIDLLRQAELPFATILVTAHEDATIAVRALHAGACDFVEKPYALETLLMAIRLAFADLERSPAEASG
jgi:two-component system response regulator FixJ